MTMKSATETLAKQQYLFVVTYQNYLYGEEYEDTKYLMENPFDVKGVFTTIEKAKHFIDKALEEEAKEMIGDSNKRSYVNERKEFIEKYRDHYDIWDIKLDKQ